MFKESEGQYAVDNVDVDWNDLALNLAEVTQEQYIEDNEDFGEEELIAALEFQDFTEENIEYAKENMDYK